MAAPPICSASHQQNRRPILTDLGLTDPGVDTQKTVLASQQSRPLKTVRGTGFNPNT
jgi:hypothetical protein